MIERSNYLWTQQFLQYLMDVKGLKEKSVKRYHYHLKHLLLWADSTQLCSVQKRRPTFLSYVLKITKESGDPLSQETQSRIMETANRFFKWAKIHSETEFRKLPPSWIDDLIMPKFESQYKEHEYVSYDEILQIASLKVNKNDLAMLRDQAAAIMLYLSGMRAGAFATAPIRAFDLEKNTVRQWSEIGVKTKNGKKATTYLLPIPELLKVVMRWHILVKNILPPTSSWYAPIKDAWGEQEISKAEIGKNRPAALNKRLRILFKAVGLPYRSAHKFRHGHAVYGLQNAKTMADLKAVSMNLMHNDIGITNSTYAPLLTDEVRSRIASMTPADSQLPELFLPQNLEGLSKSELFDLFMLAGQKSHE